MCKVFQTDCNSLSLSGEDKCVVWLEAEVEGNWSNGFWMIFEECL